MDDLTAPSSTGLAPTTAAALAYLAGPFSGAVVLLAERTNGYVKFHAWQAVLALGGLGLLAVVLLISAFLALFVSPFAFTLMYRSSAVVAIVCVGTLFACVGTALMGSAMKLPLAGKYAERLAMRP
jgi:uncharacterized membrane protein